jgi:MEDS: MEthanogen/methylotroph, DcmR Sensory domain
MNASGIEILSNPSPSAHIVYSYTNDAHLADAVCLFASAGLQKGEAVLLVLSASHHAPVRQGLERQGFNLAELEDTGQLTCENAKNLLASFMFEGVLDEQKFKAKIARMIEKAKMGSGPRKHRLVRVFGEMVDLIWGAHPKATERLEELWNEVIQVHSVPLLCAYSLAGKTNPLPTQLMSCHSHDIS